MVDIIIDGIETSVEDSMTILEAAKSLSIEIPTLCHLDLHDLNVKHSDGSCRICLVELEQGKLVPSCITKVSPGMEIRTNTKKVLDNRKMVLELLLANHPEDCLVCNRNLSCELQDLSNNLGIDLVRFKGEKKDFPLDKSNISIVRDPNKCILCHRCVTMCQDIQTVGALSEIDRGFDTYVGSSFDLGLEETPCTFCGQCVAVCPTGALQEVNHIDHLRELLEDESKFVVAQTAPAVRVALGEPFGLKPGTDVTGKMAAGLKRLGFDKVFDTNFAADLTIMEEAHEFLDRLENNGTLPIMTSCCPGWINFLENKFPEFLNYPSSCKSPHEMLGPVIKTYYAREMNLDPKDIVVVSVMPCIAKKYEANRDQLQGDYGRDVDLVLTTRELAQMIKEAGIDFLNIEDGNFDNPLGESTGAASIFGVTGGVLEATVRTAYEWVTKESLEDLDFKSLRGVEGIKEATVNINGIELRLAVVNGLGNARELLNRIENGEKYHAVEVMACPGGCINGGGQPHHKGDFDTISSRLEGIYNIDQKKEIRQSHKNKSIIKLYEEFLKSTGSDLALDLLHTEFEASPKY